MIENQLRRFAQNQTCAKANRLPSDTDAANNSMDARRNSSPFKTCVFNSELRGGGFARVISAVVRFRVIANKLIMIYLIGGSPRVGKTNLAEALARETSFPYFSLDHVTSVITPYISEQEYASKLPLFVSRLRKETVDVFYAENSAEEIVNFYLRQAETYWAGVANFIRYAVDDEHDLILEGWTV